ncbi:toll-interacting protein B-like isoform X1 [Fopius arisanus]|uniref:Toll-interacting protein B-like isoform X1 n=1 Tax=Fopius arisanus TaxID=64838 RepID=A0A9R1TVL6_9HYME|nr:PREDICTED: toll-interacting protein B-like isoform X1 [Fopius arisanus]
MEGAGSSEQHDEWKKRAFLGPLPPNFLRLEEHLTPQEQQEAADQQAALALQQLQGMSTAAAPGLGRLSITIAQAKLVKNYGMTRMDPYVRLRVGHAIYETQTATNGGKNPHWNKVIQCWLPAGVDRIYVEIYDECSFTMDELIAWGHIEIPPQVIQRGETHEDWYMLSGKQGDNQEGMIDLVFSYTVKTKCQPYVAGPPMVMVPNATSNLMFGMQGYSPVNVYTAPPVAAAQQPPVLASARPEAETELQQIAEMFPNVDKEVIKSVYDANNGKKDTTINSLLQMCE